MPDKAPPGPFPIAPPVEPMLAKLAEDLPPAGGFLFEPKWDGFRAIVFRGASAVFIQSRDLKPLDRYFPELHEAFLDLLPAGCVVDGEIVMPVAQGLDFEALQMRLHPAASRVEKLSKQMPASFVAFDLLAAGERDIRDLPQSQRRQQLEALLGAAEPPLYLTPVTRDRSVAADWLERFEGAGLDGVVAKPLDGAYQPGKRAMLKVKHARTADCVVAGFRFHKNGRDMVGSLILGLYDDEGVLHHVGVTSAFTVAARKALLKELEPLREGGSRPGEPNRWNSQKDASWEPLRLERVCEVKYDHLQGERFRHATIFQRWRPDKRPEDCRYDQLEVVKPYELQKVFALPR
jgi:ATP-dependent DNA ligase